VLANAVNEKNRFLILKKMPKKHMFSGNKKRASLKNEYISGKKRKR
jgi:hypothetical protein